VSEAAEADKRLRWLIRRGMKELDVVMQRYHDHRYAQASASERALFVRLLTQVEDPDIWAWLMAYDPMPDEFEPLFEQLRQYR
jgi:antitoxin CptB